MAAYQYVYHMDNLAKTYPGGKQVFSGISLHFLPDAKIGVVGVNGAGKSSLLRIMAGQDNDFTGEAWAEKGVRVGYLPQEPKLNPDKTVWENVIEGSEDKQIYDAYNAIAMQLAEDYSDELMEKMTELQEQVDARDAWDIDSKIEMAMDALRCPPGDADVHQVRDAMDRTTRWAQRAADMRSEVLAPTQLCFGIVQGGTNLQLRREHLATMAEMPFDGLALGGLSVGEPIPEMHATMAEIGPLMPTDRPRYVMGIGTPADLLAAVHAGIDMFDCVLPTRCGRTGQAFTQRGTVNIRNARHMDDPRPLDPGCSCPCCSSYSRAYLHHLFRAGEVLGLMLLTWHNLSYFQEVMAGLRGAIEAGTLSSFIKDFYALRGETVPAMGNE